MQEKLNAKKKQQWQGHDEKDGSGERTENSVQEMRKRKRRSERKRERWTVGRDAQCRNDKAKRGCEREQREPGGDEAGGGGGWRGGGCARPGTQSSGRGDV